MGQWSPGVEFGKVAWDSGLLGWILLSPPSVVIALL